jgi:hypothetical protein
LQGRDQSWDDTLQSTLKNFPLGTALNEREKKKRKKKKKKKKEKRKKKKTPHNDKTQQHSEAEQLHFRVKSWEQSFIESPFGKGLRQESMYCNFRRQSLKALSISSALTEGKISACICNQHRIT